MAIPSGVIFMWPGTIATIPSGWERVAALDGKFPKSIPDANTNPNVSGGTYGHTHTSTTTHNHTMTPHTHQATVGAAYGGIAGTQTNSENTAGLNHTHTGGTTGGSTVTDLSSESVTYSLVDNAPPYKAVIFIKPTTVAGGLPNLACGFSDDTGFSNNSGKYNGYYQCDGNNGTPDFNGRFPVGASTGVDGGYTGGSLTNVHQLEHTHSVPTHYHYFLSGTVNSQLRDSDPGVTNEFAGSHQHGVDLNSVSDTLNAVYPTVTTTETVQPSHKVLNMIQNRSNTVYTPVGIIGLWLGTLSTIPGNFELVSSMYGYYSKIYTIGSGVSIGETGGSNTHTHSNNTHTHTGSHNHGTTTVSHTASIDRGSSTTYTYIDSLRGGPVYHNITTDTVNTTYTDATTSANSSSNEPTYLTTAYIKYKGEKGGAFLFNFVR
jgi:hypothetical protein